VRKKIQLEERITKQRGNLFQVVRLGQAGRNPVPNNFLPLRTLVHVDATRAIRERVQGLFPPLNALTRDDLAEWAYARTIRRSVDDSPDLPSKVYQDFTELRNVFNDAEVYLVKATETLQYRIGVARLLLSIEDAPQLFATKPGEKGKGNFTFNATRNLYTDVILGLSSFLLPVLLSGSPYVYGFTAPRAGGVIVYTLGVPVLGNPIRPDKLLDLAVVGSMSRRIVTRRPNDITAETLNSTLHWWITQLDELHTELTDPTMYTDSNGEYDARSGYATVLSMHQVFTNVAALLKHESDSHTRRMLAFDTMDSLEGMRQLAFHEMCELGRAQRELTALEAAMPETVAKVLLPRARNAVAGLEAMQKGFSSSPRFSPSGIRLPTKNGRGEEMVGLDRAVALYLRLLRNAGHGFAGKHDQAQMRDKALMTSHNGSIPYYLADLAYLYLLRLVTQPSHLGRRVRV
jgi:hypothetical protein